MTPATSKLVLLTHFFSGLLGGRHSSLPQTPAWSHTIFRLSIESKARTPDDEPSEEIALQSELNLVDLAGSECAAMTGAEGALRREGAFINKSLLALSTVIEKLSAFGDKKVASTQICPSPLSLPCP